MSSTRGARLKSFFERFQTAQKASSQVVPEKVHVERVKLINPIDAYYRHKAQNNMRVLYRFAIQSRSLTIRDVFAKASSSKNLQLSDLLAVIDNNPLQDLSSGCRKRFAELFDSSILLALADLLANTARDDLDTHAAVKIYDFVRQMSGDEPFSEKQLLLFVEALNDVGLYERADHFAKKYAINDIAPLQRDLLNLQRVRHTGSSIAEWISTLNEIYAASGLTQVRLLEDESVPYMDRLAANGGQPLDGPKVSVIMPTFSPGPGIRTAIRGLLEQTWRNLEIIIVDDASPKEYRPIFDELAQLDSRIRVLHQEINHGAYVARNAGLAVATGEFITTADDDDWSHPDKIATQVSVMLDNPLVVATTSGHIRITENLELRRLNSSARFLQMNYSSLMFRKQIVNEVGDWDTVNRGADSEFFSRITEYYGTDRIVRLLDKPLGLSRVRSGSLPAGEMYRGFIGTPRVLYLWAIRQWRWDLGKIGEKPRRTKIAPRPYAVPTNFEPGRRHKDLGLFDVIYVADVFRQAKHVEYVLKEIETLSSRGMRIGYIHLDSPQTTSPAGFPKRLFQLQLEGRVTQVSFGDVAEARLLIVYDPATGMFADEIRTEISSRRAIVVDRGLPTLSGSKKRLPTSYGQALSNLDRAFASSFGIVGATDQDQMRLATLVPKSRLLPDSMIWYPHIRESAADIIPPIGQPVVGFHTFGNKYRWPANAAVFRDVYLSEAYDTHFFGQLDPALMKFGEEIFHQSHIVDSNEKSTEEFLADIDFWIYYPDPKLQEAVWEPILRAFIAGKVVILPPRFESVYREAAVYAESAEIEETVVNFATNASDFKRQAQLGQKFAQRTFSAERLYERVANFLV